MGSRAERSGLNAQRAWKSAIAIARVTELAATALHSQEDARASLRALARSIGEVSSPTRDRIAQRAPTVFFDYARDAATSFGDANAARIVHLPLAAAIEAIKIIDDVQDEEPHCLATEIGVDAALTVAMQTLAWCLELTAALPFEEETWSAAATSIARGVRDTAIGQMLETTSDGGFDAFWFVVDHKTPPLVATALELGALAAGATPSRAAALTQLAIPIGRLLQIGDDCHDALDDDAGDWRAPALNLLMRFSLSGPNGEELATLLRNAADRTSLREAQLLLLRDGALGYAMHAQLATLQALREILDALALPHPAPFLAMLDRYRDDTETLLRKTGVSPALAGSLVRAERTN